MLKVANSVISASRITGVLPVVNGGTGITTSTGTGNTVLSASPTLSGDVNFSTGNLVIGTAGKGIDFSATSSGTGTMTSELLADYEEGTWEAAFSTTGGSVTISSTVKTGTYTKIGRVVTITGQFEISSVSSPTGVISLTGLPFACAAGKSGQTAVSLYVGLAAAFNGQIVGVIVGGDSKITFQLQNGPDGLLYNIASSFNASTIVAINVSYSV